MEIFLYYVLPNIALFGSIYIVAKAVEHINWYVIENYDDLIHRMEKFMVDRKRQ